MDTRYLLLVRNNDWNIQVYSRLTLTSTCTDFPVPISFVAVQRYFPLSETLAESTMNSVPVLIVVSIVPSIIFIQVKELTDGYELALQSSVNDSFSFTIRSGWPVIFTSLGLSAFNANYKQRNEMMFLFVCF